MASNNCMSTEGKLLSLIDDVELISKELIENTIAQKHLKLPNAEHSLLTELLVMKNNELKETLKLAEEQAKINLKMDAVKTEVEPLKLMLLLPPPPATESRGLLHLSFYTSLAGGISRADGPEVDNHGRERESAAIAFISNIQEIH
uniref:Uncharacterized protein n=1 Tax=Timema bartmani TaxID=61472 RepID=A0A7R9I9G9_9NEOP|nr:unnamed protein product [Timema bartmani]